MHAGLDLSRKRVDVCLLSDEGVHLDQLQAPPDADGLRTLARRIEEVHREPVCAAIESMTGARFVHDTLEQEGWAVGPLTKHGPRYLRWALIEATMHALRHPAYSERYQHNERRLGKQRGAKVAQIDIARRLCHAIWHMLTRGSCGWRGLLPVSETRWSPLVVAAPTAL